MQNPSGVIHYVITTEGPQPASRATAPLDYDHYVLKQIEPLVRTVAEFYDIDVDASVNGRPDLFR
jgi:DNA polymerase-2